MVVLHCNMTIIDDACMWCAQIRKYVQIYVRRIV